MGKSRNHHNKKSYKSSKLHPPKKNDLQKIDGKLEAAFPEGALVLLSGVSGCGKSSFAERFFEEGEVVSSDHMRLLLGGSEENLSATSDAWDVLHNIVDKRLARGLTTVVDATNLKPEDRKMLLDEARKNYAPTVIFMINASLEDCLDRQTKRDRQVPEYAVKRQWGFWTKTAREISREHGYYARFWVEPAEWDTLTLRKFAPAPLSHIDETGPWDIIGDPHGCWDELTELLGRLGYELSEANNPVAPGALSLSHPQGRRVVWVGDVIDRGPDPVSCLLLAMQSVVDKTGYAVGGNHEAKLIPWLRGRAREDKHGFDKTRKGFEKLTQDMNEKEKNTLLEKLADLLEAWPDHLILNDGDLVVAHAGLPEPMHGKEGGRVRSHALFGATTGARDSDGYPVRLDWAKDYRGKAHVVYGHTPIQETRWRNRTICIDRGVAFGGHITALRWPEKEEISIPAKKVWAEGRIDKAEKNKIAKGEKVFPPADDLGVIPQGGLFKEENFSVKVDPARCAAAQETLSLYGHDPRVLLWIPPTLSPVETSPVEGWMERPEEAFAYYKKSGASRVMLQTKHMGSRMVSLVCRDEKAFEKLTGVKGKNGALWTRSGRPFFTPDREEKMIHRLQDSITRAGMWEKLDTDWILFDGELMPWSAKAQSLIKDMYAPSAMAARCASAPVVRSLAKARTREGLSVEDKQKLDTLAERYRNMGAAGKALTDAYLPYSWTVNEEDEQLQYAPWAILAYEGHLTLDDDPVVQIERLESLIDDKFIIRTETMIVDLNSDESCKKASAWWEDLTAKGGEGVVVKPLDVENKMQAALKVRGREYLRMIYGAEYLDEKNLKRLKKRSVKRKRELATKGHLLGRGALTALIEGKSLSQRHPWVLATVALDHEPVDPRL